MNHQVRVMQPVSTSFHGERESVEHHRSDRFPKINNLRLEALKAAISTIDPVSLPHATDEFAEKVIHLAGKFEPYLQGR